MNKLTHLEPMALWKYFEQLNAVPRPSKKEERVRQFMVDLDLPFLQDMLGRKKHEKFGFYAINIPLMKQKKWAWSIKSFLLNN